MFKMTLFFSIEGVYIRIDTIASKQGYIKIGKIGARIHESIHFKTGSKRKNTKSLTSYMVFYTQLIQQHKAYTINNRSRSPSISVVAEGEPNYKGTNLKKIERK